MMAWAWSVKPAAVFRNAAGLKPLGKHRFMNVRSWFNQTDAAITAWVVPWSTP